MDSRLFPRIQTGLDNTLTGFYLETSSATHFKKLQVTSQNPNISRNTSRGLYLSFYERLDRGGDKK